MYRLVLLGFMASILGTAPAQASGIYRGRYTAEIDYGKEATHIGRITKDTLVVVAGSTYSFTVDTPENQGLVRTGLKVKQLPGQLAAKDGSRQKYQVTDPAGKDRSDGDVNTGDRLVVTSQDGRSRKVYHLVVRPMALTGRLWLQHPQITVGAPGGKSKRPLLVWLSTNPAEVFNKLYPPDSAGSKKNPRFCRGFHCFPYLKDQALRHLA
jgi:hypothetical protein